VKQSIEEFEAQLVDGLRKYAQGGHLEIVEKSIVRLKARYHIGVSLFIDIFYAIRTEKISFAVVQKGERVSVLITLVAGIVTRLANLKIMSL